MPKAGIVLRRIFVVQVERNSYMMKRLAWAPASPLRRMQSILLTASGSIVSLLWGTIGEPGPPTRLQPFFPSGSVLQDRREFFQSRLGQYYSECISVSLARGRSLGFAVRLTPAETPGGWSVIYSYAHDPGRVGFL